MDINPQPAEADFSLPEHAHVRISFETMEVDPERAAWLAESERGLRKTWGNDDVFNALLPE